jgi:N-acetylglucosamine kinase-like BadF-type ATPase
MTDRAMFLAIDGGNSKTHALIGTDAGELLAFAAGPGSSPDDLGVAGTVAVLDALVGVALTDAALPDRTVLDRAEVYLAGADLPIQVERLSKAVGEAGWARHNRVDNDVFALLRAGTQEADAIVVVCGAGINAAGRTADGRVARFPALGQFSGDWGGGHHLANLALWHAARGEDGRGPSTALVDAVTKHFGVPTVEAVSAGLHLGELDNGLLEALTPALFEVAAAGDQVARQLIARQADEVIALATITARRLDLLDRPHAVVLGGGVLTAGHALLDDAVRQGIRAAAPYARILVVTDPPVLGAALSALDALGAPEAAGRRLAAAYSRLRSSQSSG